MSYVLYMGYVPSGHARDHRCIPRSINCCWYPSVVVCCTGEEKVYQGMRVGVLLFVCCQLGDAVLVESVGLVEAHVGSDVVSDADG